MSGALDRGTGPRSLTDIVNNGPSEGGSFAYDPATLEALVRKWLELARHYDASRRRVVLGTAEPPGLDIASRDHVDAANRSGTAYMTYLRQNLEYCIQQAQLLQNTLDDYLGVEHRSVAEFMKLELEAPPQADSQAGM